MVKAWSGKDRFTVFVALALAGVAGAHYVGAPEAWFCGPCLSFMAYMLVECQVLLEESKLCGYPHQVSRDNYPLCQVSVAERFSNFLLHRGQIWQYADKGRVSANPDHARDFSSLSSRLAGLRHPCIPQIEEFGEHYRRPFRSWKRRKADYYLRTLGQASRRELLEVVSAYRALEGIGVRVETLAPWSMGRDSAGFFLTIFPETHRFPVTNVSQMPIPYRFSFPFLFPGEAEPAAAAQMALGIFVWNGLSGSLPYTADGSRVLHRFESQQLTKVLLKMTDLDDARRYPSFSAALVALETALQDTL